MIICFMVETSEREHDVDTEDEAGQEPQESTIFLMKDHGFLQNMYTTSFDNQLPTQPTRCMTQSTGV